MIPRHYRRGDDNDVYGPGSWDDPQDPYQAPTPPIDKGLALGMAQGGQKSLGTPPPTGGGGGGGTVGNLLSPFAGSMPAIPQGTGYLPQLPTFTPPTYKAPDAFKAPSAEDAINSPGYQFRLGQGEQALQQSAAARGVLNTGGTLRDILGYGQNFASGEYANVYGRAADTYDRNYKSQYTDPYAIAYKGAVDSFAPKMTGYTTEAAAGQRASEMGYNNAWDQYLQNFRQFQDQRDSTWNKNFQYANT